MWSSQFVRAWLETMGVLALSSGESELAPLGHGLLFDTTCPHLCEPCVPDVVLRQIICQASPRAQDRAANV